VIVGAAALAWAVYLYFFGPVIGSGEMSAPALTTATLGTTDYRWTLKDLDGKSVDFSQYKGRVVFLNLWATWCGPCVSEIPSIANLASDPKLQDVAFVCVSVEDEAEPVRQFVERHKLGMSVFLAGESPPAAFQTKAIPATFVIAPDGRIVSREIGAAQWDDPSVIEFLARLKNTPGGNP
jgi:thiol-disulfide isomerase/thioredoxin